MKQVFFREPASTWKRAERRALILDCASFVVLVVMLVGVLKYAPVLDAIIIAGMGR